MLTAIRSKQASRFGSFRVLAVLLASGWLAASIPAALAQQSTAAGNGATAAEQLDRADVEQIVRDYLLAHPEIIVEALQSFDERRQLAAAERRREAIVAHRDALERSPTSPVVGNPDGDVTVVEFFDYRCPYCRSFAKELTKLMENDPGVRVVMKEYPILSTQSIEAARAALAAHRQDGYEAFHFALIEEPGDLSQEHILATAHAVGLDADRLAVDMADPALDDVLRSNYAVAEALEITGTPAIVIGDQVIPGVVDYAQLVELVAAQRNHGDSKTTD